MTRKVSYELFKAMKYQVAEEGEFDNLWQLFKTIKSGDEETAEFWRSEVLIDYRAWQFQEMHGNLKFWLVEILEDNILGTTTFVDIVRNRATAKAVARHLRKEGEKKFIIVREEPTRWV